MKQGSPTKPEPIKHDIFDGDLTEEDSDVGDDTSTTAPSTSYASSTNTHKNAKAQEHFSRPQRSKKVVSYDESGSEESATNTPTQATNRKRRREPVKETPNKRSRVDSVGSKSPEATFKKEQNYSPLKKRASANVAESQLTSTQVSYQDRDLLVTPSITRSNKPVFIYLSFDGTPSAYLLTPEGYWWPAKEISKDEQNSAVIFQLYGDDGKGESRTFTVEESFPYETRSMWYPAPPKPRFNQNDFQSEERIDKRSFTDACSRSLRDDDDEDSDEDEETDLFPMPGLLDFSKPNSSQESEWSPPDYISLVGYRVLCRKAGSDRASYHWPARVKEYFPPKSKAEKPIFLMDFFDWKVARVTRDCFFTPEDEDRDQFARCNINYTSLVDIWEEKNTATVIDIDHLDVTQLPEPITPIPEPIKFVEQLTMEQQFVYIIPFLQRILAEKYPPSQLRIDTWMKGGVYRSAILNNPIQSGNMVEVDYERLGYLLPKWVDDKYPPIPTTDSQLQQISPQSNSNGLQDYSESRGSRRFRELSAHDRIQFITDVLLGEAVVQLLLFREGKRTSLDVLDDGQELIMHNAGMKLSVEESASRLVRTVMEERRRARRERRLPPDEPSEKTKRTLPAQRAAQRAAAQGSQG